MDIRCPSCSTLYEFDGSQIGPKGVNVRCTACGQVFKVRVAAPDEPKTLWMVKRDSTGEIINFDELSTLQRWIIEQKVSRRDLISKTGDTWKALGSINELQAFFKVVDELNEPRNSSRDTDGYLTAETRSAPDRTPDRPPSAALPSFGGATQLVPGHRESGVPQHDTRPSRPAPPKDLPDVRPARQSAPIPSVPPPAPPAARQGATGRSGGAKADYTIGGPGLRTEAYSIGAEADAEGPAITFGSPPLDSGRSADYTAEYAALRRQRSRWPSVLLALLLLAAGAAIVVAALRPEIFGFGTPAAEDTDADATAPPGPSRVPVLAPLPAPVTGQGSGDGSGLAAVGSGSVDGSGDASDGSAADVSFGTRDAGASDAPDDTVAQVAEPTRPEPTRPEPTRAEPTRAEPTRAEPTRAEPTRAEPTRAEPTRAEPTRAEPTRAEPTREPEPSRSESASGYDGLMSAGNAALRAGDPQAALNHFSNATDARPNSAEAHVGVARAYDAMARYDLAAVRYERATTVNSRYTPAWLGLGDARRRSGDTAGACRAYERVLSIVRTGSSADRASEAIRQLRCE